MYLDFLYILYVYILIVYISIFTQALRGKKAVELQYEEAVSRINELTIINVNLSSTKAKIEQELATVVADYDEITKELRISDERYQRVQVKNYL